MSISRRLFIGSAAAAGTAIAAGAPASASTDNCHGGFPDVTVRPDDPRYAELVARGFNQRYIGKPDQAHVVYTPAQIENVLNSAVKNKQHFSVRSGGHCFVGLVDDPANKVLIDVSEMKGVYFDQRMKAICVESGVTIGELLRSLYYGWGVTLPAGVCPSVGAGGHISGGGYGPLSRKFGLTVDHLYGVEVVTVGADGRAKTVVATRNPSDPNRDLWWAHTGGGGGNFGVITKYWFRTPGISGNDPTQLLPRPPARLLSCWATWSWDGMTEQDFKRLVRNHGTWHAANSAPGSAYESLHSSLHLNRKSVGSIFLEIRIDGTLPNAQKLLDDYIAAVGAGVSVKVNAMPWEGLFLANAVDVWVDPTGSNRNETKGSNLRKPLNDEQVDTVWRSLTDPQRQGQGKVYLASYGCTINTVAPSATAVPQRSSMFKMAVGTSWADPAEDAVQVQWVRDTYTGIHKATGGAPAPNDAQDGAYINYPDLDLLDPNRNRSGVPWYTLYYKDNYPALQRIKAKYDPANVFHHPLSIRPA
ncbi:FAD-binding oxidoreductase [Lentzea flava]|uniref:FAD-linked oxidase n=1 Tax=Lentzea flava TaxID=103732 RepID=A0ABQ2VB86_9PSEU|nr:FAD-binding protein [Lentzea flava]MCP2203903.1 FAD/FMN-containing dehydrogenase [Lentzea flava]GGU72639.1 FAD-linked oxidase [Lentzea flava]